MPALSGGALKKLSETPGRHRVDDGLYLLVREGARPSWVFRYVAVGGQRRDMALGSFEVLSLPSAREEVLKWQRERLAGRDPIEVRKHVRLEAVTSELKSVSFLDYATEYHAAQIHTWKNAKHAAQWLQSIKDHLGPLLNVPLSKIDSGELLKILGPLNAKHHETAIRVRQRVEAIYGRAIVAGIVKVNPAIAVRNELKPPARAERHHPSLPYQDMPQFIRRLRDCDASQSTRLALEWLILSVARTNEVIGATWSQINADRSVWTVGAGDMKAGEKHQVPITWRMREILAAIEPQRGPDWEWIFPSPQGRRNPMSNGAFLAIIRRFGLAGQVTAHGMRSSFSTWAYETTDHRSELIEAAQAHQETNAVKKAYNRARYWERRIDLAEAWTNYCIGNSSLSGQSVSE